MILVPKFLLSLMLMINGVAISAAKNFQEDDYPFPFSCHIADQFLQAVSTVRGDRYSSMEAKAIKLAPLSFPFITNS